MTTIFAQASAAGRAGVSVIRISGPDAFGLARQLCGTLPNPGHFALRTLSGADGTVLDQALVLVFKGPHSFTGEDVVELHTHGSVAITRAVLAELAADHRARLAEPGEFTRRALENDRMDLSQVEGLSDLIDAETEAQRAQAFKVFSGSLGAAVERWRADLLRAAALLEVTIDFADEDVPVDVAPEVLELITKVAEALNREVEGSHVAERIRDGFEVAILGAPNAGKSTLLNSLAGRDAVITSEIAGTTRDVIELQMDVNGLPVTFLDTAGLRESGDQIERIGIERAKARADAADLRVFLQSEPNEIPPIPLQDGDILLLGKGDLHGAARGTVSGATGQGVPELLSAISDRLSIRAARAGTATHLRHRQAMTEALGALEAAGIEVRAEPMQTELAAEHLRAAIRRLEALIGRVDVEAVLGEIFSRFCLGK